MQSNLYVYRAALQKPLESILGFRGRGLFANYYLKINFEFFQICRSMAKGYTTSANVKLN